MLESRPSYITLCVLCPSRKVQDHVQNWTHDEKHPKSYWCHHKQEPQRTGGGAVTAAPASSERIRCRKIPSEWNWIIVPRIMSGFWKALIVVTHLRSAVAENPPGGLAVRQERSEALRREDRLAPGSGGNAIPWLLCNTHLRKRLAPSLALFIWSQWQKQEVIKNTHFNYVEYRI